MQGESGFCNFLNLRSAQLTQSTVNKQMQTEPFELGYKNKRWLYREDHVVCSFQAAENPKFLEGWN